MACLKAGEILLLKIYHYNCIQYSSMVSWQSLKARYSKLDSWSSILENFEDQDVQARLRTYQDRLTISCFIHHYCFVFNHMVSLKSLFEILEKLFGCLQTWNSKLAPQNSILDSHSQKLWGSRIEFRVATVNLSLNSTVHVLDFCRHLLLTSATLWISFSWKSRENPLKNPWMHF